MTDKPKPAGKKRGPKARIFTADELTIIQEGVEAGVPQYEIAKQIGWSESHLSRQKRKNEQLGQSMAQGKVLCTIEMAGVICRIARNDKHPKQLDAAKFWLRTQAGWRETTNLSTPQGESINFKAEGAALLSEDTAAKIIKIIAAAQKAVKGNPPSA